MDKVSSSPFNETYEVVYSTDIKSQSSDDLVQQARIQNGLLITAIVTATVLPLTITAVILTSTLLLSPIALFSSIIFTTLTVVAFVTCVCIYMHIEEEFEFGENKGFHEESTKFTEVNDEINDETEENQIEQNKFEPIYENNRVKNSDEEEFINIYSQIRPIFEMTSDEPIYDVEHHFFGEKPKFETTKFNSLYYPED